MSAQPRTTLGNYSRAAYGYGRLADIAEAALIEVSDNGNGRAITDDLRWVVFTAVRCALEEIA